MKIKHAYLTAANPEALAQFYREIGMPVRFADGQRWIQFATDGAAFCIAGPEESAVQPSSNAVVVFEVEGLEAALAKAVDAGGINIAGIRDMGSHGRAIQIRDPQNNLIQFFERAKP
jgi:predicted enzyme related to lactoylglutathione lyase